MAEDYTFIKIDKDKWVKLSTITMFYNISEDEKRDMAAHNAWVVTNAGSGDHYHRTSYTAEKIAEIVQRALTPLIQRTNVTVVHISTKAIHYNTHITATGIARLNLALLAAYFNVRPDLARLRAI